MVDKWKVWSNFRKCILVDNWTIFQFVEKLDCNLYNTQLTIEPLTDPSLLYTRAMRGVWAKL